MVLFYLVNWVIDTTERSAHTTLRCHGAQVVRVARVGVPMGVMVPPRPSPSRAHAAALPSCLFFFRWHGQVAANRAKARENENGLVALKASLEEARKKSGNTFRVAGIFLDFAS